MKLKTYTAPTMAQALAQVRKDLGTEAMILHTRSYRTGSWLGLGGKPMVEITASSPQPSTPRQPRRAKRAAPQPQLVSATESAEQQREDTIPEIVVQRSRVAQPIPASVPQAAPNQSLRTNEPDDRAALLQGLMGNTRSLPREPRPVAPKQTTPTPTTQPAPSIPSPAAKRSQILPIDPQAFQPATFRTIKDDEFAAAEPAEPTRTAPAAAISAPTKPQAPETPESRDLVQSPAPLIVADQLPDFETPLTPRQAAAPEPMSAFTQPTSDAPPTPDTQALQAQIEALQKMMGQVLDSTRRTAVAVNKSHPDGPLPPVEMHAPLHALYNAMIDNDVTIELADRFAGAVRDRLDADELRDPTVVRHALLREIESSITTTTGSLLSTPRTPEDRATTRPHILALIGPTGVGKTTTVAKLAATAKLRHAKEVALITSDTYRIAAVEQLRTYASIIGLQLRIANTPEEMKSLIESLSNVDLIIIDTAGRSQNNHTRLDELAQLIAAAEPDETHLVLSSTVGDNVLRKTAERFRELGPESCIVTKLDEAVTTGMLAGISDRIGLPISYITVGQEVPDDILPARADRLARAVLDGPSAVVPQS